MPRKFFQCGERFESVALDKCCTQSFHPEENRTYGMSRINCIRTCFFEIIPTFEWRILIQLAKNQLKSRNLKVVFLLSQTIYWRDRNSTSIFFFFMAIFWIQFQFQEGSYMRTYAIKIWRKKHSMQNRIKFLRISLK